MSLKKKTGESVDREQFTINIIQKLRAPSQLCVIHALQSPLLQFNTFFHITNPLLQLARVLAVTFGLDVPSCGEMISVTSKAQS